MMSSMVGWTDPLLSKVIKEKCHRHPGEGLGLLNQMSAERLANKGGSPTSDLFQPFRSSLSALGTNQWLLSAILVQWGRIDETIS